jgi:mannose-6-phosphate isomerase
MRNDGIFHLFQNVWTLLVLGQMILPIALLKNQIQPYAWGSPTAISELLGIDNNRLDPQAELWMGAHPKAPSHVLLDGREISMIDWIEGYPEDILGESIAQRFSYHLPFLFKVLAAAKPLSIQVHPNLRQAAKGFDRENRLDIAMDDPVRNYRDSNHKPEVICALTPFWALKGFRSVEEIADILSELGLLDLFSRHLQVNIANNCSLKQLFENLWRLDARKRNALVAQVVAMMNPHAASPVSQWIVTLNEEYPNDIGVLGPIIFNLVKLTPGEALYLPAQEPHAYLEGVGIELMANSDNVIRGGLTPKHIDVEELLQLMSFKAVPLEILTPEYNRAGERVYQTPAAEFRLSCMDLSPDNPFCSEQQRSVEIYLAIRGKGQITSSATGQRMDIGKGQSFIVPAAMPDYRIKGDISLYKATVPIQ